MCAKKTETSVTVTTFAKHIQGISYALNCEIFGILRVLNCEIFGKPIIGTIPTKNLLTACNFVT